MALRHGKHPPHSGAAAAEPIGDALLREASGPPPAGAIGAGLEEPGEEQDRQQQQRQGPGQQAGRGHVFLRPVPGDVVIGGGPRASRFRLAHPSA